LAKKASKPPKVENLTFKKFLLTLTVNKIKDLINLYNDDFAPEENPIKNYSQFRKKELIEFLNENILEEKKDILIKEFEEDLVEDLVIRATSLITGEHNVEIIKNAAIIAGGKGYNVWFSSKYAAFKASLHIENNSVQRSCNCKIGSLGGLCIHQMAIYLMLLSKNVINRAQIPFNLNKELYNSIQKRLELHASQKLFKIEPSIMFEDGYKIYVNNNLVTLEWGGDFPGKTTKDISRKEIDVDRWISEKVTDLIVRYIKVRKKEGKPSKMVIDSYDIISKIMEYEDLVKKILRKFSALADSKLPTDEKKLEKYLREGLKESSIDLEIEPPFSAYEGEKPYIFVSYTHRDKAEVYPLINKLNQEGFNIWYDEGIHLSTDWCNTIAEKLMGCALFLSFISPHINESENSKDEIFLATEENKPFIAVYLKETDLVPGIKMRIRRIQGIMKYEMDESKAFEKLKLEIGQLVAQ
jgi:hypothetical protein